MRSGELAHLSGVSADTIRHYERLGILPEVPRTASGYRMYGRSALERVRLVQRALRLGFSLPELAEILRIRDRGDVPCQNVLTMTEEKLRSLARQIKELQQTERYMRELVRQWRAKLTQARPGGKAMLLESIPEKHLPHKAKTNFTRRKRT